MIAFYNYLGAGRLSYPIHSRATLTCHPLLCVLAPSALLSWGFFFLVFRLTFALLLSLLSRSALTFLTLPLLLSYRASLAHTPSQLHRHLRRTLARSTFPSPHRTSIDTYVCVRAHARTCVCVCMCTRARAFHHPCVDWCARSHVFTLE